jgi:hypothetical protein
MPRSWVTRSRGDNSTFVASAHPSTPLRGPRGRCVPLETNSNNSLQRQKLRRHNHRNPGHESCGTPFWPTIGDRSHCAATRRLSSMAHAGSNRVRQTSNDREQYRVKCLSPIDDPVGELAAKIAVPRTPSGDGHCTVPGTQQPSRPPASCRGRSRRAARCTIRQLNRRPDLRSQPGPCFLWPRAGLARTGCTSTSCPPTGPATTRSSGCWRSVRRSTRITAIRRHWLGDDGRPGGQPVLRGAQRRRARLGSY